MIPTTCLRFTKSAAAGASWRALQVELREVELRALEPAVEARARQAPAGPLERAAAGPSTRPVNLARFDDRNWMASGKDIWFVAEHLCEIPHTELFTRAQVERLTRVDSRLVKGEAVGHYRLPGVRAPRIFRG